VNVCLCGTSSSSAPSAAIAWTGWRRKIPVLMFRADALVCRGSEVKQLGGKWPEREFPCVCYHFSGISGSPEMLGISAKVSEK